MGASVEKCCSNERTKRLSSDNAGGVSDEACPRAPQKLPPLVQDGTGSDNPSEQAVENAAEKAAKDKTAKYRSKYRQLLAANRLMRPTIEPVAGSTDFRLA
eukprot:gnl/TRDRNA2_/TRDRNA2_193769_c0_seq1.p1 gnl/TRDRNA2_/TRDRNA2_193769_c0~~gnl/TRDRNA2_/TRDRNA2_193769_c0_seq1.p1  ORF type:complete len:111 (+),score=25.24 gnl/TRDRNA2_/TRDRNA2_193769_c0_seq1:33-335(+)